MTSPIRDALSQQVGAFYSMVPESQTPDAGGYFNIMDYVLDRAEEYESAKLTRAEMRLVLKCARSAEEVDGPFLPKQCFANAAKLVLADYSDTLVYTEGYAYGSMIPTHHAWATVNDKVVDLTWAIWAKNGEKSPLPRSNPYRDRILGLFTMPRAYMGIGFQKHFLIEHLMKENTQASLIDDWVNGWPLLQEPRLSPMPAKWKAGRKAFQLVTNRGAF
jgi:hypothetical protein